MMISDQEKIQLSSLNKRGSFISLFLPLAVVAFSASFILFLQNIVLGVFSAEALTIGASVAYLSQGLQMCCTNCAKITQAHVSRWSGEGKDDLVGSGVWQMIWFAFLSMFIMVPAGFLLGHLYFQNLSISERALPYFYSFLGINFLYPLGTVLSSFFLGIGRVKFILLSIIGFNALNAILLYLLILGIPGYFPSLGLFGGTLSAFIIQGGFCIFLFYYFIKEPFQKRYGTGEWRLQLPLFWECLKTGLFRAIQLLFSWGSWIAICHLMTATSALHGYIFAVGSSLFFFSTFVPEGLVLAIINRASYFLGKKSYHLLPNLFRNAFFITLIATTIFAIPLLLFPWNFFQLLFPKIPLDRVIAVMVFGQFFLFFFMRTINSILLGFIMALQDAKFMFFMGLTTWVLEYGLSALSIKFFQMSPAYFWLLMSGCMAISALLHTWRLLVLRKPEVVFNGV